jgi:hypothetical protein
MMIDLLRDRSTFSDMSKPRMLCRIRRPVPWELALLAFPTTSTLLAAAGFLFGLPIGRWQALCGLAASVLLCCLGPGTASVHLRKAGLVLQLIVISVVLAGLSVMYSNPDAECYHRPASMLMARGWNPVFDSTAEAVDAVREPNEAIRVWHVAYLPRAFWIFGALLYRTVGFVEAADAFNILTFVLSYVLVSRLIARVLGLKDAARRLTAGLLAASPAIVSWMFGGSNDSAFYSLFLVATAAATLYLASGGTQWLAFVVAAFALLANLKFTGVVCCGVITLVFLFGCVREWWSGRAAIDRPAGWLLAVTTSAVLAAVIGFSPYVTSWVRFGGPFYPAHTFDHRVPLSNRITEDFLSMNADAKRMGYFGRFGYAYISERLTLSLYGGGADGGRFAPTFNVSGGVRGFGPVFRAAFLSSIVLLPFARVGRIGYMLACILLSVLLQPTMYIGYARYVPQFYAFPLLVFIATAKRAADVLSGCGSQRVASPRRPAARITGSAGWVVPGTLAASAACYCLPLLVYPLSFAALQWIISVQNLEITTAMRRDPQPLVLANSYYARRTLQDDYGCPRINFISSEEDLPATAIGRHRYVTYFSSVTYFSPSLLEDYPVLTHVVSGNDPSVIASRNRRNIVFFVYSFLPQQAVRIPAYLWDVACLRFQQFGRVWF